DCLYAPGLKTLEEISAVVAAAAPKPVNVLMGAPSALTVADLAALGVRRISVGGALARSAWGGFMRAAKQIAEEGSFNAFADAAPSPVPTGVLGKGNRWRPSALAFLAASSHKLGERTSTPLQARDG